MKNTAAWIDAHILGQGDNMKNRALSLVALWLLLEITLLPADVALAADASSQGVPVRILQITTNSVTVDGQRTFKFDPKKAQCFTPDGYQTTCDTLVGIGYADKARLTIVGDTVLRIDIIDLQQ